MTKPICPFSGRKLITDREFVRWRCKMCGRRVHVVDGWIRSHRMSSS